MTLSLIKLQKWVKTNRPNEKILKSLLLNNITPVVQTIDYNNITHEYSFLVPSDKYNMWVMIKDYYNG